METKIELLAKIEKQDFECTYGKLNTMVEFKELKKALEKDENDNEKHIALCKIEQLIDECSIKNLKNEIKKILRGVLT